MRSLHLVEDVAIMAKCPSRLAPVRAAFWNLIVYYLCTPGQSPTQSLSPPDGCSMMIIVAYVR